MRQLKAKRPNGPGYHNTSPFFHKGQGGFFQRKPGTTPAIQKDKLAKKTPERKPDKAFSNMVADLLKKQLSDKSLQGHLKKLGATLQKMAVESTDKASDQPQGTADRLAALGVASAFERTSKEILKDSDLKYLRKLIEDRVRQSPELALASALAGLLLVLGTGSEIEGEIGKGFGLGGALKVGIKDDAPDFQQIKLFASYAHTYFGAKVGGEVRQEKVDPSKEDRHLVGETTGEVRIGPKHSSFTGKFQLDTNNQLKLSGRFTADLLTLGRRGRAGNSLSLFTEVSHSVTPDKTQTTINPGASAKLRFGANHFLQFGAGAKFTTDSGFQQFTGSVVYGRKNLRLTLDMGIPGGVPREKQISPGSDARAQLGLTLFFK